MNDVITTNVALSSRLKKREKINSIKVNAAKTNIKMKINPVNVSFDKIAPKSNKIQEMMKIIIIVNNNFFFDRFFNPVMNLMIIAY